MWKALFICGLALISLISADEHDCSAADGATVREEWNRVWTNSDSNFKTELAKDIILRLVEKHPEAKDLFAHVKIDEPDSGEFAAHALRIINSFDLLVNLLDDRDVLEKASKHLGHQHAQRNGVLGKYFETFLDVVLFNLKHITDGAHIITWKHCLKEIVHEIVSAIPE